METSATENFELSGKAQELLKTLTDGMATAMNTAREKAFRDLTDYLRDYALEDFRANTLFAARAIVADVVSGRHYLGKSWAVDLTHEAHEIREYLWKNYSDHIVKAQLIAKDEEIARLKQSCEEYRRF